MKRQRAGKRRRKQEKGGERKRDTATKGSGKDSKSKEGKGKERGVRGGDGKRRKRRGTRIRNVSVERQSAKGHRAGSLRRAGDLRGQGACHKGTRLSREQGANRSKETRELQNKEQTKRKRLEN